MSDSIEWRWADVDGSERVVAFGELSEALASKALPSFILVWRTGWSEWVAATNVAELTAAVGIDETGPPSVIRPNPALTRPPKPPISRYAAHLGGERPLSLMRPRRPGTLPPPRRPPPPPRPLGATAPPKPGAPPRRTTPSQGTPRPPGVLPKPLVPPPVPPPPAAAPIPIRDVQPTLAEMEPARSPTLRPVGALPPPPRTMPHAKVPTFGINLENGPDSEPPSLDIPSPLGAEESAESDPEAAQDLPSAPQGITELAATLPAAAPESPPAFPPPEEQPSAPAVAKAPRRAPEVTPRKAKAPSRQLVTVATAASVLLPGTLLFIAALLKPSSRADAEKTAPSGSASAAAVAGAIETVAHPAPEVSVEKAAAAGAAPPPHEDRHDFPATGCTLAHPAVRLATTAFVAVPLSLARAPDGKLAVGFAAAKDHAVGLVVDPETLGAKSVFDRVAAGSSLLGFVPLAQSGKLGFARDTSDPKLSFARTVDASPPFTLGVAEEGFVRSSAGVAAVIWPGRAEDPTITTPRVASAAAAGYAVAFRHGGQSGKVLVGWLDAKAGKQTELKAVASTASFAGTPVVAVNDRGTLVAFAARSAAEEPWHVELAVGGIGTPPGDAQPFQVPAGGPGGDAMSPAVEGLAPGRFLVQWTEGTAGSRAVRAQVVSTKLEPLGDPVTLSLPDQIAGQGAVWTGGNRAVSLFLVQSGKSHELWGASLACP